MSHEKCCCGNRCEEFKELKPVLDELANVPGSIITILQKTQDIYGYLPEEALKYISDVTGIKPAKIYGIATFYKQFRMTPVGKNLIMLCKGTACHVNGAENIEEAIIAHLGIKDGETTEDGLFTLNTVSCLGCCSSAPVMMVKSKDGAQTYGKLTKDSVIEILDNIAKGA